ncbi:MAG: ABC transporter ATP-binding protein [Candidatus Kryptoniota bacterium]
MNSEPLSAIYITNLEKEFQGNRVLTGLNLSVAQGETFTILGKSGTGKSVTLKCIVGLLSPDKGEIFVKSKLINPRNRKTINEVRRSIGFLFQGGALYDSISVRENLTFNLRRNRKISPGEANEKAEHYLTLVGLADAADKMPSELSGGMRKRAALARALITEPEIILYDEPTTGLDPITSVEISQLISDMHSRFKVTAIVVTHDILCASIVSNRAGVLNGGVLKYSGTLSELASIKDPEVEGFFRRAF